MHPTYSLSALYWISTILSHKYLIIGFNVTFMTGFGVSASYGLPDVGLVTATEMLSSARTITSSLSGIPCVGDADTVSQHNTVIV